MGGREIDKAHMYKNNEDTLEIGQQDLDVDSSRARHCRLCQTGTQSQDVCFHAVLYRRNAPQPGRGKQRRDFEADIVRAPLKTEPGLQDPLP